MFLGAVVGLVLGGSQALSRSFFGSMVPESASAEFYGSTRFTKFSSIWGPLVFGVIKQADRVVAPRDCFADQLLYCRPAAAFQGE